MQEAGCWEGGRKSGLRVCTLGGWKLCFNIVVKQFGESLFLAVVSTARFDRDVDT